MPPRPIIDAATWSADIRLADATRIILAAGEFAEPPEFSVLATPHLGGGRLRARLEGTARLRLRTAHDRLRFLGRALAARPGAAPVLRIIRSADPDAPAVVWAGSIEAFHAPGDGTATLLARIDVPGRGRLLCRDASRIDGLDRLDQGTWLPQVFGECDGIAPALLRPAADRNQLAAPLTATDTILRLVRPVTGPVPGRVQVDDELIDYTAIGDGGFELGTTLIPLMRPTPRDHGARADAILLGEGPVRWCACDHPATVADIRVGRSGEGGPAPGVVVVPGVLGGRAVTLLESATYPVARRHGPIMARRETPIQQPGQWLLTAASTALRPLEAFSRDADAYGAVLTTGAPRLEADSIASIARTAWRHDRLTRAALAFDLHALPGWLPTTRLRVTIARGAATLARDVNFQGTLETLDAERASGLPAPSIVRREVIAFDAVLVQGVVAHSGHALDGIITPGAMVIEAGGAVATLTRIAPWPGPADTFAATELLLHLRGDEGAQLRVRVDVPTVGTVLDEILSPPDPADTIRVPFDAAGALDPASLGGLAVTLKNVGATDIEVAEAWLEATVATPQPDEAHLRAPVPVAPVPIEVPIDDLCDPADPWALLDGGTAPPLRIALELVGGIAGAPAIIRRVRWAFEVLPATSVAPSEELRCRVRGRLAGSDGTCEPAAVLRELLSGGDFASEPADVADVAADALVAQANGVRGVRFRAAWSGREPLDDAITNAAMEAGALLVPSGGRVRPSILAESPASTPPVTLAPGAIIDAEAGLRLANRGEILPTIGSLRPVPGGAGAEWGTNEAPDSIPVEARWITTGGPVYRAIMNSWLGGGRIAATTLEVGYEAHAPIPSALPSAGEGAKIVCGLAFRGGVWETLYHWHVEG